jgi:hypothetical protein
MPKRTVAFTVTPKDGVRAFTLDVGMDNVTLVNGKGTISVTAGEEQVLVWRFAGDPGAKLAIVGEVGAATVVEVKQSTIPPHRTKAAGFKLFTVE